MNDGIYSSSIFIGREKEITEFQKILSGEIEEWILYLKGNGGVGKTQLLQRYIEIALTQMPDDLLITDQLVDFYWTTNQHELGIMKSIAEQLQPTLFQEFSTALQRYEELAQTGSPNPDLVDEKETQARKLFFEIYSGLDTERILLLFDTAEIGGPQIHGFLQKTLFHLKQLHPGTIAIIAGRPDPNLLLPEKQTIVQEVKGFGEAEVTHYFQEHQIDLDAAIIQRITILTDGRPILIALTLDWIQHGYPVEELINCAKDDFKELMVRRVQELRFNIDQAILAMAHFHRRFNEDFLAHILQRSEEEAQQLIESASAFSFVKYRPPQMGEPGSCLLHDEMREMINQFVWPKLDPFRTHRQGWNRVIADYYLGLIQESEANHQYLKSKALKLERLFYLTDLEREKSFEYAEALFREARSQQDIAWMKAINYELENVRSKLDAPTHQEILWDALVSHFEEDYSGAVNKLKPLAENEKVAPVLYAEIRSQVVESLTYASELQEAIALGTKWETWFQEQLAELATNQPHHQQIQFELGKLYNSVGLAHRKRNNYAEAISYYEKAVEHFARAEINDRVRIEIANTKNNLAYVYHKLGRDDEALSHGEGALKVRGKLGSPGPIGFSYNVLAMIYVDQLRQQQATAYFHKALNAFQEAGSDGGKGLVYVGFGRALRQLGRHKERYGLEPLNPTREEYQEAERMLSEAVNIFRRLGDEANLSEALNEKGTLLRQQEKWQEAVACLQESSHLSEKTGNLYRQVDNLVDIAIVYDYQGIADLALQTAAEASQIALDETKQLQAYNLFAKAQEVVANNLFARKDYDKAFEAVANACIYIMRLDPAKQGESAAKRELYYDHMVNWAEEKLLRLPSRELVQEKTAFLIKRWQQARLANSYPGFIIRMQDAARNYEFLKR
jgi:tetratricopeptide (TPR) repeat protein